MRQEPETEDEREEEQGPASEPPLKSYQTILEQEIQQADEELDRPARGLLVSGLIAGIGVGIGAFLMAVADSLAGGALPDPLRTLLLANAFTVGFIIVILGRTDLFTEYTTIAILPVLTGDAPLAKLARLWGCVFAANVAGAAVFAAFLAGVGPALGSIEPASLGRIAAHMTGPAPWVVLLSAVMAGWLMGLLSWLVTAARDTISQVFFVWLVTFAIGFGGLHHSITGSVEVLSAVYAGQGASAGDFLRFLALATAGNAAGGIAFAVLIHYSLVIRRTSRPAGGRSARG